MYSKIYFILHLSRFVKLDVLFYTFLYQYILFVLEKEEEIEPLLGDGKPYNKSTVSPAMEEIKLINPGQQITRNSESHEEQLPSPSVKEEKAMPAQGMGSENKSKLQTVILICTSIYICNT